MATSFLPNYTLYSKEGDPAFTKDIEAAKALLASAGITDGGPEIELRCASGFLPRLMRFALPSPRA